MAKRYKCSQVWRKEASNDKAAIWKEDIITSNWPKAGNIDNDLLQEFDNITKVVAGIRTIRKEQNIPNKNELSLEIINNQKNGVANRNCKRI